MMHSKIVTVETAGRSIIDITDFLMEAVSEFSEVKALCHVFLQHTSASLFVGENADPAVHRDIERFMEKLVPDSESDYEHSAEGPDDMPAHIRSMLTNTDLLMPVINGRLAFGQWQSVYLWEHRNRSFQRHMIVTIFS